MKKTLKAFLISTFGALILGTAPLVNVQAVGLNDVKKSTEKGQCEVRNQADGCDNSGLTSLFRTVVNILLFLVGSLAVIMLVIGGLRYVTSNGDQNAVTSAKNTILYAIIGIVVAFLAYAAVNFVITQLQNAN
jgi:ABC-type Fe3+ transport system permease subunit